MSKFKYLRGWLLDELGIDGAKCRRKLGSDRKVAGATRSLVNAKSLQLKMENLRGLFGITRIDRVPNARVIELCGVKKGVGKKIEEIILRWFGHVGRMGIIVWLKVKWGRGECMGSCLVM